MHCWLVQHLSKQTTVHRVQAREGTLVSKVKRKLHRIKFLFYADFYNSVFLPVTVWWTCLPFEKPHSISHLKKESLTNSNKKLWLHHSTNQQEIILACTQSYIYLSSVPTYQCMSTSINQSSSSVEIMGNTLVDLNMATVHRPKLLTSPRNILSIFWQFRLVWIPTHSKLQISNTRQEKCIHHKNDQKH